MYSSTPISTVAELLCVSPHSCRSPAGSRPSSGWRWCVWGRPCWSRRWRLWGGARVALRSALRSDWTTRCSPRPAGCRCFLTDRTEERVSGRILVCRGWSVGGSAPCPLFCPSLPACLCKLYDFVGAFTLLFLSAHHCEEGGEGRHDDQRHCDGHGTNRPRPGGVDCRWKTNAHRVKRHIMQQWKQL